MTQTCTALWFPWEQGSAESQVRCTLAQRSPSERFCGLSPFLRASCGGRGLVHRNRPSKLAPLGCEIEEDPRSIDRSSARVPAPAPVEGSGDGPEIAEVVWASYRALGPTRISEVYHQVVAGRAWTQALPNGSTAARLPRAQTTGNLKCSIHNDNVTNAGLNEIAHAWANAHRHCIPLLVRLARNLYVSIHEVKC